MDHHGAGIGPLHGASGGAAHDDGGDGASALLRVLPLGVLTYLDIKSVTQLELCAPAVRTALIALEPRSCSTLTVSRGRRIGEELSLAVFRKFGPSLQTLQVCLVSDSESLVPVVG